MSNLENLRLKLDSLVIFRNLLDDIVIKQLHNMLKTLSMGQKSTSEKVYGYAGFVSALFKENHNLTDYLWECILSCENIYVRKYSRKEPASAVFNETLKNELMILEELSKLPAREVKKETGYEGFLPEWETGERDFYRSYMDFLKNIPVTGYGMYYKYRVFSIKDGGIVPVKNPDSVRLADLKGYEAERQRVVDNTVALLKGKPAANVLLYGDAGTGKSSTVKAVANEYAHMGLRLIEIRKNQILEIPDILSKVVDCPLKFILFIDDLSFARNNEEIGVLKAILEGTAAGKSPNIVIYATSNRRHIVRETFEERGETDIHVNETIQEQVSLSERFGLAVNFSRPGKEKFLMIVRELARDYGLENMDDLELKAERYALERGGRSPRVARQFVEYLNICR